MTFALPTDANSEAAGSPQGRGAVLGSGAAYAPASSTFPLPLPRHAQFALLRGLHDERSQTKAHGGDRARAKTAAGSVLAGLTVWGFVLCAFGSAVKVLVD